MDNQLSIVNCQLSIMNIQAKERHEKYWGARTLSFIFHPLFIPFYLSMFLLYVNPYAFAGMDDKTKLFRAISVFMLTAFFPAFTVFLLWRLKFISSIFLRTQKERIIPYVAAMFFYFWLWYVSRKLPGNPSSFVWLTLGVFLSSIAALMANSYCKISMHAIAMGNLFLFFLLLGFGGDATLSDVATAIFTAGVILSARFFVSDHTAFEVYFGFLLGILCQFIAAWFA